MVEYLVYEANELGLFVRSNVRENVVIYVKFMSLDFVITSTPI